MLIQAREGSVEPDYGQFYAWVGGAAFASDRVSDFGYEAGLEALDGFVYVGTLKKYSTTPVRVEVHDREPGPLPEDCCHAVEESLSGTGTFEVHHWDGGDPAVVVETATGPLRLRVLWFGLVAGLREGLPEDGNSDERLVLQLWPAPPRAREVLRWWEEWLLPARTDRAPDGRRQIEGTDAVCAHLGAFRPLRLRSVEYVAEPPLPGGGGHCGGVWGDPEAGVWWADGYDARRVLRVASDDEVRELMAVLGVDPWLVFEDAAGKQVECRGGGDPADEYVREELGPCDPRWMRMLDRIGYPIEKRLL